MIYLPERFFANTITMTAAIKMLTVSETAPITASITMTTSASSGQSMKTLFKMMITANYVLCHLDYPCTLGRGKTFRKSRVQIIEVAY